MASPRVRKVLKVQRKDPLELGEEDFMFDSFNRQAFVTEWNSPPIYKETGELIKTAIVGPISLFKKQLVLPTQNSEIMDNEVEDSSKIFEKTMTDIKSNIKLRKHLEKAALKNLPINQRLKQTKDARSLKNFEGKNKEWTKISRYLSKNLHKERLLLHSGEGWRHRKEKIDNLERAKSPTKNLGESSWYCSLRCNTGEIFKPLGNQFSGLFISKSVKKQPPREKISPLLTVRGDNKLKTERKALIKTGVKHLKAKTDRKVEPDETIAEHYESRFKAK